MNANARHRGTYTSHEAPHMIQNMHYDYPGDPALGDAIAAEAAKDGLSVLAQGRDAAAGIRDDRADALHERGRLGARAVGRRSDLRQRRGEPEIRRGVRPR